MRAIVQRVSRASVTVDNITTGEIGPGLLILVGVRVEDTEQDASRLSSKIVNLRIFPDAQGKMNLSVLDSGGACLIVSQFTVYADTSRGRRPSFEKAARPEQARPLYEAFVQAVRLSGVRVAEGIFQAHMIISLANDGPITLVCES